MTNYSQLWYQYQRHFIYFEILLKMYIGPTAGKQVFRLQERLLWQDVAREEIVRYRSTYGTKCSSRT